ncbi:RND family transporter [Haloarcula sp. JP-L23]|uniref:efflux RND transporter permease subunit n=1 Tax=Haloarcula sp. JP-L23 TaxID=2716717 RepID=UPI00140F02DC|nr:MMPL family transporter [Haloarcula sp. JP-L23]
MSKVSRLGSVVTEHSALVVAVMLVLTGVFSVGLGDIQESSSISGVSSDTPERAAHDEVQQRFTERGANTTVTLVAVSNETGNALSRATLLETLRYQRALYQNRTLNRTLADDQAVVSVANVVARAAVAAERRQRLPDPVITGWTESGTADIEAQASASDSPEPPTLEAQIAQLESMNESEVSAVVTRVLDPKRPSSGRRAALRLLPQSYEPGAATADTHLVVVVQETGGGATVDVALPERVTDGQVAARQLAKDRSDGERYYLYSGGLMSGQQSIAISDSLAILGPLALMFVLVVLSIAYRDPIDIGLGLVGIGVVLVWTMGLMGWLGIAFGQTMIAVPILLIGLSVDYALHVVMRYREEREDGESSPETAMHRSLVGVGPALALVTATTAIGFLANLTSQMADLRMFGVVSAIGILATLCVFGLLVPALKIGVDSLLARVGWDRRSSSLGSMATVRRALRGGSTMATRAPVAVLLSVALLTAGGAAAATQVDVATPETSFMADDPPAWTDNLPDDLQPSDYFLKENRRLIYGNFQTPDKQGYVYVEGNVTDPGVLDGVARATDAVETADAVLTGADDEPAVVTPVRAMQTAAAQNESFNATLQAADTDADGVPDRNVAAVYDAFYETTPRLATRTLHRSDDGTYDGLLLRIAVNGNLDRDAAVAPLYDAAGTIEDADGVSVIATGSPVTSKNLNDGLATTVVESLALTLCVVLVLLMVIYHVREGAPLLGLVTLLPIFCSVTWLLGTMWALSIPIGLTTALVGSISVGLGVDYAIHISQRFTEELDEEVDTETALVRTSTGTGSALLSSAATTAAGFGVLSFALLPALRQFGLVLAIGIVYSFLASVYVQPSLLALWSRYRSEPTLRASPSPSTTDD